MKPKDFRIREQYGKFYAERRFTEWKAERSFWGKLQPKKIIRKSWKRVNKYGNFVINISRIGYYQEPQDSFKTLKKAQEFVKTVCKEPIYHLIL